MESYLRPVLNVIRHILLSTKYTYVYSRVRHLVCVKLIRATHTHKHSLYKYNKSSSGINTGKRR